MTFFTRLGRRPFRRASPAPAGQPAAINLDDPAVAADLSPHDAAPRAAAPLDPHDYVMRLALGHVTARAVYALVHLGIPEHLAGGPRSAAELAALTGARADALLRLLRAATALDLCVEDARQRFSLTSAGEALRSGAPRHAASAIRQMGHGSVWGAIGELIHSVTTGEPALERAGGAPIFSDLSAAHASLFGQAMIAYFGDEPAALAAAYDWSGIGTLVDVGGSTGNLLATLLRATPGMRGILYDLPATAAEARRMMAARGLADRCTCIGGSFFAGVPSGGDAYLLSHVIHDWREDKCLALLQHVRRAIPGHGRLLIVEHVITPDRESDRANVLDLISLTVSGGRHRTRDDHAALMAAAGFALRQVVPTDAEVSIVEGRPV